ncbi:hypothetical protein EYA84_22375 [Verrucosispora sp. SN26_14.1]|uniref:hypothetical protein n=1 Tax=Verrucosispora sp. SN26_14.1 TaxID=2527879 RepID=UPI0010F270F3|nr:hypothetical protein [Verrucosispora sp. SN26_14.1]TBL30598.1 hypothetical protein EYA84_22375 [Verrucosispora sp. SN26_14.1]
MAAPVAPVAGHGTRTTAATAPHPARPPARQVAGPSPAPFTVAASVPAGPVPRPVVTRAASIGTSTSTAAPVQRTPRGSTSTAPHPARTVQRTGPVTAGSSTATRTATAAAGSTGTTRDASTQTGRDGGREDRDSAERFHHLDRRALDELAHRLVEPISRLLRTELRRGRERSGRWLDGGR